MADHKLFDHHESGTDSIDDVLYHDKRLRYNHDDNTAVKNHNEEIKKFTNELKIVIDQLNHNDRRARECVLEIAKLLDESGTCRLDQIGRCIKKILEDKIKEGKITVRWIDESLPKEYKREYRKREPSSLSQKNAIIEHSGPMDLIVLHGSPQNNTGQDIKQTPIAIEKNTEPKTFRSEHTIPKPESEKLESPIEFIINKSQKDLIIKGLDNCNQFCRLKFNESGTLVEVASDHSVEVQ